MANSYPGKDHPRSRGVYGLTGSVWARRMGSSPLARGLPRGQFDAICLEDHPRSRGVYPRRDRGNGLLGGSSPLARGLHYTADIDEYQLGIIPARAGFTMGELRANSGPTDHPRSRGVYAARGNQRRPRLGSSPLARGLLFMTGVRVHLGRIIPARAGFTPRSRASTGRRQDHPRSRGVYPRMFFTAEKTPGSSPLARGLLAQTLRNACSDGIIPARAGFTPRRMRRRASSGDHPRSRGVYCRRRR